MVVGSSADPSFGALASPEIVKTEKIQISSLLQTYPPFSGKMLAIFSSGRSELSES